jgi:hypothetical protein
MGAGAIGPSTWTRINATSRPITAMSGPIDADERRDPASAVVAAWPELPEAIKAGILATVKAALKES